MEGHRHERKAGRGHRPDDPSLVADGRRSADTAANSYSASTPSKSKQFARPAGACRSFRISDDTGRFTSKSLFIRIGVECA